MKQHSQGLYSPTVQVHFDILEHALLTDTMIVDTPMELNVCYSSFIGIPLSDPTLYHRIIQILVYLIITRPNFTYVAHVIGQLVAFPTTFYSVDVICIL